MSDRARGGNPEQAGGNNPFYSQRFDRRTFVALAGTSSMALMLGSCGGDDDGGSQSATSGSSTSIEGTEINMVAWPGHSEKHLIGPFEKATGAKIRVKEYADGDEMIALILESPPGTYDVIMHDPEVIEKFGAADGLMPMNPDDFPAAERDFFDQFKPSSKFPLHWYDDQMMAVAWDFAYLSLSYNTEQFAEDEVTSYDVAWSDKADDRVGWATWWVAGLSSVSLYLGVREGWWEKGEYDPMTLTNEQFATLREFLLSQPKTTKGFYGIGDSTQALANGDIWLFPGGSFVISGILKADGKPVTDVVPEEGAVMYTESLSIAKEARNVEGAKQFINYCISPEGCALKGTLPAYQGIPVNRKSWDWIAENDPEWVDIMRIDPNGPNVLDDWEEGVIALRRLPTNQSTEEWADLWEEYKSSLA